MSDYKFVVYEKLDGDAHTSRMLKEHHGNIPEEITDKQLEPGRVGVEESTIEKLLEKNRTGSAEVILEKNLNDSKNQFGSKHRNPEAYEGNINKLEEKRISGNIVESEKYEVASETPKRKRWWEVKSEDGLKIAHKKKASIDDYLGDVDWDYLERGSGDIDTDDPYGYEDEENEEDDLILDLDEENDSLNDNFPIDEMDVIDETDVLSELSYEVKDVGGTPTAEGVIKVSPEARENYNSLSDPNLAQDLEDFWSIHHPDLPFSLDIFTDRVAEKGIITYSVGVESPEDTKDDFENDFKIDFKNFDDDDLEDDEFEIDDINASTKFPIVEATKKKMMKK